ncbi:MAG: 16S rRNA (guanine(527)-N(7))-methyltransferase RsmG [Rhodobacteraceae bacterium]|nr:16S rRNA (guanine(527)-N(7))-methyltransferase RsmG [Paracoccaceae bacterium]
MKSDILKELNVSRETLDRLDLYESLIKKWNPRINLISRHTLNEIWTRHFLDSAQIWRLRPENPRKWLDLGSGGGFPGLVIAIIAAEATPEMKVTLVESDARKAGFLMKAGQEMGILPEIIIDRAERLSPQHADVVSARALAPLDLLLDYAAPHLAENGRCLFSKGENYESELTAARKCWTFSLQKSPSRTGHGGVILQIGDIRRANSRN